MTTRVSYPKQLMRLTVLSLALSWPLVSTAVEPPHTVPGQVSVERVQGLIDAAVKGKERELEAVRARVKALEEENRRGEEARSKPDRETAARQQKAETDLSQARASMQQLQNQVAALERQRDEARAQAQAADKRAHARPSSPPNPDVALRRERDQLKAALAEEELSSAQLREQLQRVQQEAVRLRQPPAVAGGPSQVLASVVLRDGQILTVPGCGDACPSFTALPVVQTSALKRIPGLKSDVGYSFLVSSTEVTVRHWKRFMSESGHLATFQNCAWKEGVVYEDKPECIVGRIASQGQCDWRLYAANDNEPIRCISYVDVKAYIKWLQNIVSASLPSTLSVELPSESQWEYFAKINEHGSLISTGLGEASKRLCDYANLRDCNASEKNGVTSVGSKRSGLYGLYDIFGNVSEMTSSLDSGRIQRGTNIICGLDHRDSLSDIQDAYCGFVIPLGTQSSTDIGFRPIIRVKAKKG